MQQIIFVLLGIVISSCYACSCYPGHIQGAFCRSDIVIKGKATSVRISPEFTDGMPPIPMWDQEKIYDVEIMEIFKVPETSNLKVGEVISAVTGAMGSMCGGSLRLDTELLISDGDVLSALSYGVYMSKLVRFGLIVLNMDDFNERNKTITNKLLQQGTINAEGDLSFGLCSHIRQFNRLTNFQLEGLKGSYTCECDITYWYKRDNKKSCNLFEMMEPGIDMDCLHKFGQCVPDKDDICDWDVEENESCRHKAPIDVTFIKPKITGINFKNM